MFVKKRQSHHRNILFPLKQKQKQRRNMASSSTSNKLQEDEDTLDELLQQKARIEELSSSPSSEDDKDLHPFNGRGLPQHQKPPKSLPPWLQPDHLDLFPSDLSTTTSAAQATAHASILPLLLNPLNSTLPLNAHGFPSLRRAQHIAFLHSSLAALPAPYVVVDASRPWLFYWALAGLTSLGEDVSSYRDRLISTVRPLQNATGGFGGGHGQLSHCACSYACVLALACVGALEVVDRRGMWEWLSRVKQSDGGFRMAVGAEEDIRGAYCALTILTLLNLPPTLPPSAAERTGLRLFTDGLGKWVGRCQTYEGGMASMPGSEAHGAYAFCGLACLSLLDAPHISIPQYLDTEALVRCLASLQTRGEGGFAGRTGKLVDACYSHWVGGCWSFLEAAVGEGKAGLWNREGLIRYLLTCCQQEGKRGGMRDKPTTRADAYHTCYSLAGLSAAMNRYRYEVRADEARVEGEGRLMAAFQWKAAKCTEEEAKTRGFEERDRVEMVHPVFVIPFDAVETARKQFEGADI